MKSIKKRLLVCILGIVFIVGAAMVGVTYYELKEEMDEVFDGSIKQIAEAIAVHDISDENAFNNYKQDREKRLKGEEEFLIQVWNNDTLSYSSHVLTPFPRQGAGGVQTVMADDQEWRYYGITQGEWLIQVSQPIQERHVLIWEIYAELLTPMLILIPIMAGLIWVFVGFGFRPLTRVSESIEKRSSTFLDKLPENDVPLEVYSLVKALNGLLDRLSDALEHQRQFTANAAHELRTPLTAVKLELDILKRTDTHEEREQSVGTLFQAVDRCTRLVQQLLELARQEPGLTHEDMNPVALKLIAEQVIENMMPLAKNKSIDLKIGNFEDISISGQKYALETLLSNLVCNAVLYTPQNGKVRVSATQEGHVVILKVSDNGSGIPIEERDKVFDRFHRLLDTNAEGSGLGLSIVKAIAERHNASVTIEDGLEGRGCSFVVRFANA